MEPLDTDLIRNSCLGKWCKTDSRTEYVVGDRQKGSTEISITFGKNVAVQSKVSDLQTPNKVASIDKPQNENKQVLKYFRKLNSNKIRRKIKREF